MDNPLLLILEVPKKNTFVTKLLNQLIAFGILSWISIMLASGNGKPIKRRIVIADKEIPFRSSAAFAEAVFVFIGKTARMVKLRPLPWLYIRGNKSFWGNTRSKWLMFLRSRTPREKYSIYNCIRKW